MIFLASKCFFSGIFDEIGNFFDSFLVYLNCMRYKSSSLKTFVAKKEGVNSLMIKMASSLICKDLFHIRSVLTSQ